MGFKVEEAGPASAGPFTIEEIAFRFLVFGDSGNGKAQPVDEPVLTPDGWVPIGELQIGDLVYSEDGLPTKVTGVFPQGVRPIRSVVFNDGVSVRCDSEHLWAVLTDLRSSRGKSVQVKKTVDLEDDLVDPCRHNWKWRVPLPRPIQTPAADLPLDPYLMGILLGGGCFSQDYVRISTADEEICQHVRAVLPGGCRLKKVAGDNVDYGVSSDRGVANDVMVALRRLGLSGCRSFEKFIPEIYLLGSPNQRLALLQGLMDTDGYADLCNGAIFSTTSPRLRDGVADLVRSLGGGVRVREKIPTYRDRDGVVKDGRLAYDVTLAFTAPALFINVFRLDRKKARLPPRELGPARKIVAIEDAGEAECVCISVAHPSRLYITTGYTLTHNTMAACRADVDVNLDLEKVWAGEVQPQGDDSVFALLTETNGVASARAVNPKLRYVVSNDIATTREVLFAALDGTLTKEYGARRLVIDGLTEIQQQFLDEMYPGGIPEKIDWNAWNDKVRRLMRFIRTIRGMDIYCTALSREKAFEENQAPQVFPGLEGRQAPLGLMQFFDAVGYLTRHSATDAGGRVYNQHVVQFTLPSRFLVKPCRALSGQVIPVLSAWGEVLRGNRTPESVQVRTNRSAPKEDGGDTTPQPSKKRLVRV